MAQVVALGLDRAEGGAAQAVQLERQHLPLRAQHLPQVHILSLTSLACLSAAQQHPARPMCKTGLAGWRENQARSPVAVFQFFGAAP